MPRLCRPGRAAEWVHERASPTTTRAPEKPEHRSGSPRVTTVRPQPRSRPHARFFFDGTSTRSPLKSSGSSTGSLSPTSGAAGAAGEPDARAANRRSEEPGRRVGGGDHQADGEATRGRWRYCVGEHAFTDDRVAHAEPLSDKLGRYVDVLIGAMPGGGRQRRPGRTDLGRCFGRVLPRRFRSSAPWGRLRCGSACHRHPVPREIAWLVCKLVEPKISRKAPSCRQVVFIRKAEQVRIGSAVEHHC